MRNFGCNVMGYAPLVSLGRYDGIGKTVNATRISARPSKPRKTAEKGCRFAQNTGFARREFTLRK